MRSKMNIVISGAEGIPALHACSRQPLAMLVSYFERKLIQEVSWRDLRRLIGQTCIILTQHLLLTGNRGKYLRVV